MQAASRSATRSRCSTSRSANTPPSDYSSPPSNLTATDLPETDDRPGNGSVGSFMGRMAPQNQTISLYSPTSHAYCGLGGESRQDFRSRNVPGRVDHTHPDNVRWPRPQQREADVSRVGL